MSSEMILTFMIAIMVVAFSFILIIYFHFYRKSIREENRYLLYAVRDELALLVSSGMLKEDEFLFKEMYPFVNSLINKINSFRFSDIVSAILRDGDKLRSNTFIPKLIKELDSKPEEVLNVFIQFSEALKLIFMRNSLSLRIIYRVGATVFFAGFCYNQVSRLFNHLGRTAKTIKKLFQDYFVAYEVTRALDGVIIACQTKPGRQTRP